MNRYLYLLFLGVLVLSACKKDKFPDEFSVFGPWKEQTSDVLRTEIEFKRQNIVLLKLRNDTIQNLMYLLDKPNELELFQPEEFPDGRRTAHRLTYNEKDESMTIYGLYPSVGDASETVFVRK